ncbi:MAG: hypothetical protein J0L72_10760 [Armatimonadetes bacterium]|nr:hypothetical protein [Armatimonadota bacterium]
MEVEILGAGSESIPNYGTITFQVQILRFGKKPRDKGGRPKKSRSNSSQSVAQAD